MFTRWRQTSKTHFSFLFTKVWISYKRMKSYCAETGDVTRSKPTSTWKSKHKPKPWLETVKGSSWLNLLPVTPLLYLKISYHKCFNFHCWKSKHKPKPWLETVKGSSWLNLLPVTPLLYLKISYHKCFNFHCCFNYYYTHYYKPGLNW